MNCGPSESSPEHSPRRPFICPCGKGYLSYPALFTHVKQKHDGKPPGHLIRPKSQNKRGRPRKVPLLDPPDPERTEFRSLASRMLFDNEEDKDLGYLLSQVELAKQRYRANLDFVPPITPSHLALLSPQPATVGCGQEGLRGEVSELLLGSQGEEWLGAADLEELIGLNVPYLLSLEGRHGGRRPAEGCELELRAGVLEFLEVLRGWLSRGEFRNVELLMALLVYFFARELDDPREHTTADYLVYLNTFAGAFLPRLAHTRPYARAFLLHGGRAARTVTLFHQWVVLEGLSGHAVELALAGEQEQ